MKNLKKLAIYMDHNEATIIEFNNKATAVKTIVSDFNHFQKEQILQKGESHLHHKEQDRQDSFYKKLRNELLNCSDVVLFGATTAKTELCNILKVDNAFDTVDVTIRTTDILSERQQIAFVNDCFIKG